MVKASASDMRRGRGPADARHLLRPDERNRPSPGPGFSEHLKDTGQWDNTLIVLTSDHGEQLGDHHLMGKIGYFDQSYHIPMIIRDPGR